MLDKNQSKIPEIDELVIATVKKIFPYGAFCELEEYRGREAFIHISEVAPRWIKNIHNFLREGQRVVGRVYRIIPEKNLIDISLKRATEADQKRKLDSYGREKRARKLLEVTQSKMKKPKMALEEVWAQLEGAYGDVFSALEEAASKGEDAFKKVEVSDDWQKAIIEIAQTNIKKQKKRISGVFTIQIYSPDGVDTIKRALTATKAEITYLGAPHYMVEVEDEDYKRCEKKLKNIVESVTEEISSKDGVCKFERKEKE